MNTPGDTPELPRKPEALAADVLEKVELNPENIPQIAEYIAKIRDTESMKKLQSWFDGLEEDTKRKLLRAEDVSAISKLLEKMPTPPSISDITKGLIIMAGRYSILDVREDILAESRGISGDIIYLLPEGVVTIGLRALGAGNLIPLYKIGKKIHSGDETYAPRIRKEVKKKMAELSKSTGNDNGMAMKEAA